MVVSFVQLDGAAVLYQFIGCGIAQATPVGAHNQLTYMQDMWVSDLVL